MKAFTRRGIPVARDPDADIAGWWTIERVKWTLVAVAIALMVVAMGLRVNYVNKRDKEIFEQVLLDRQSDSR